MTKKAPNNFSELISQNRDRIKNKWYEKVIHSYPPETVNFFKRQTDEFANPIGATIKREIENIFAELLKDKSSENLSEYVDAIVRFRAIQGYTPSQAVSFFWMLKRIVREDLGQEVERYRFQKGLTEFEDKVDQLCFLAFDIYMQCREKIWELKAKESQNRTRNLLRQKANIEWKISDENPKEE